MSADGLGWGGVARIGLVQAAIGAVTVLTTSTLNRVMVVELGWEASVPGALVGFHYLLQLLRPRWGHGSDGGRRTPWVIGGMAVLAAGGALAGGATAIMAARPVAGLLLAVLAFALIGIGVGMAGTALLTLLAEAVAPARRAAAASVVWITMIAGFVVTTVIAAVALTPFSYVALVRLSAGVSLAALLVTPVALWRLERPRVLAEPERRLPFARALRTVWADRPARRFTLFIAVSMLAYAGQDLILEPFAGLRFGLAPAETTAITSVQNGGTLVGMVAVALLGRLLGAGRTAGVRQLTVGGCLLSAAALALLAVAGGAHAAALLRPAVAALGLANGVYAAAAIGLMMGLAGERQSAGVRMGVWGAAQAMAFGAGGFLGTVAVDAARVVTGAATPAYLAVFGAEAVLFVVAATLLREQRAPAPAAALATAA